MYAEPDSGPPSSSNWAPITARSPDSATATPNVSPGAPSFGTSFWSADADCGGVSPTSVRIDTIDQMSFVSFKEFTSVLLKMSCFLLGQVAMHLRTAGTCSSHAQANRRGHATRRRRVTGLFGRVE